MSQNFLSFVYAVPTFLVVLTIIVFVHEMAHYLVARWNGVAIHTFSIGFGPELFGWNDRNGTRWRISAFPLGGYVRFVGDMNASSATVDRSVIENASPELARALFVNKNVWQRIAVVVAGPVANIIFAFLVLYALLLGLGRYTVPPVIDSVTAGSVAEKAGIQSGDIVLSVDGYRVRSFDDFQRFVATAPQRTVRILVERGSSDRTIVLVPELARITDQFGNSHRVGRIGVTRNIEQAEIRFYRPDPIEAIGMTFEEIRFTLDRTVAFLGDFFVGRGDIEQIGGPIKTAKLTGEMATLGIDYVIRLMAFVSLNIGIFNLLPIPMLDGGHLVFYLAEAVRGRPLSERIQEIALRLGLALIATLMLFTLVNDTGLLRALFGGT